MRPIPHAAGIYLAVLQFVFALCWTAYAIYLPRLAASVGLSAGAVIVILMLDQAIFTITDFSMGVAADKVSRVVGRLGYWAAALTALSCAAFVVLPFIADAHLGAAALLGATITWAVTSSALRAPPLMLLGKYAARPAIPYLASLAMLGLGVAGAVSPYLAMVLTKQDPRLPFIISSVTLVLVSLALTKVERTLAKQAPANNAPPKTVDRAVPAPILTFGLAIVIFAFGFQLHFFFNSAPLFKKFTSDIGTLMPVFWVGFSVGMFPASLITKQWGGLPVMGAAGLLGAIAHRAHAKRHGAALDHRRPARRRCRLGLHPDERVCGGRGARRHRPRGQNHRPVVLRACAGDVRPHGGERRRRAQRSNAGAAVTLGADRVLGSRGSAAGGAVGRLRAAVARGAS